MLPAVEKQIEFSTHGKSNYQFTGVIEHAALNSLDLLSHIWYCVKKFGLLPFIGSKLLFHYFM